MHEIVQCLVAYCGNLSLADSNLFATEATAAPDGANHQRRRRPCKTTTLDLYDAIIKAEQQSLCASVQEAYDPAAQAAFLASCKARLQESPVAMSLLVQENGDKTLSLAGGCRVPRRRVARRAEAISTSSPQEVLLARRARKDAVYG
ncbi:hypothetical protein OsJ_30534 [Oryza sativa Japonica Group]|uniref:Uncharacterized protein n=2 Tax=Oryza sativa subsp. japonica TaxID=39947 RepID=A0A9K3Y7W7_ORYSJ|nr:Hypothetical protein [Oryza sativa]AAP51878.1 hypothetical protein LOC_Os10g02710 [Oryza sativa Japonica Group]EAZ15120.1 hypothetical protein OsJ_30534 [Oryza sativa Japonica Group]